MVISQAYIYHFYILINKKRKTTAALKYGHWSDKDWSISQEPLGEGWGPLKQASISMFRVRVTSSPEAQMHVCGLVEEAEPTQPQGKNANSVQKKFWHKGDLNPDPFRCEGTGSTTEPPLVPLKGYFFLYSHSSTKAPPKLLKLSVNKQFFRLCEERRLVEAGREKNRKGGRGYFFFCCLAD